MPDRKARDFEAGWTCRHRFRPTLPADSGSHARLCE